MTGSGRLRKLRGEGLARFLQYRMADERDGTARLAAAVERATAELRRRFEDEPHLEGIPMACYGEEGRTDLSYSVGLLLFADLFGRVGAPTFDRIIGGYYREFAQRGASTKEFVRFAIATAGAKLEPFFEDWLATTAWRRNVI